MQLSLSVRIAEGFLSKEEAILPFEDFAKIAQDSGYDGVCLRGSQLGVHSSSERVKIVAQMLTNHNLGVSMITGDFATVYNCLLYTSPSPRDATLSRMPSSA